MKPLNPVWDALGSALTLPICPSALGGGFALKDRQTGAFAATRFRPSRTILRFQAKSVLLLDYRQDHVAVR